MPELLLALTLLATGLAYARGLQRLWQRAGAGRVTRPWQAGCFFAGLVAVVVSTTGPLDQLAAERLWGHMVQHVVLMAVASALVVLGNPVPTLLWALPTAGRRRAMAAFRRITRGHATAPGWLAWAVVALAVQSAALWAWHAPGPYQSALQSDWTHAAEHLSFVGAAALFWWAVIGAERRSLYGPGVVVVFLAALQGTVLGAFMALASQPWYPAYAAAAPGGGLTPLEDQQLAGVIMWGPAGALYLLAAVLLFAAWLGGHANTGRPEPSVLVGGASTGR